MVDRTQDQQQMSDLDKMAAVDLWPHWPLLPLKNPQKMQSLKGNEGFGVLMEVAMGFRFYEGQNFRRFDPDAKFVEFKNPRELARLTAAGWVVD